MLLTLLSSLRMFGITPAGKAIAGSVIPVIPARRQFILPDGTKILATRLQAHELLDRFAVPREAKKQKTRNYRLSAKLELRFTPSKQDKAVERISISPNWMIDFGNPRYAMELQRFIQEDEDEIMLILATLH